MHVVLLGDSIFDNQIYVQPDEPDVRTQLQSILTPDDKVTLLALDGSIIKSTSAQIKQIPDDATHLVVSIGGNNLLDTFYTLKTAGASSVAEVMMRITTLTTEFTKQYREMLDALLALNLPIVLCTIYNPRFPTDVEQQFAVTGLRPFNDCIVEQAVASGLPLIELRHVCSDDADYANPIEPSAKGGQKIANAIKSVLETHDFSVNSTYIYK